MSNVINLSRYKLAKMPRIPYTPPQCQTIADKYTGDLCQLYTLDGIQRAKVTGRLNQFATIASLESALSIEVNWQTVERKMESDKLFYAC